MMQGCGANSPKIAQPTSTNHEICNWQLLCGEGLWFTTTILPALWALQAHPSPTPFWKAGHLAGITCSDLSPALVANKPQENSTMPSALRYPTAGLLGDTGTEADAPNLHNAFAQYRQGATTLHKAPAPNAPVDSKTTHALNLHNAFAHYRQGATTLHKVPAPNAPVESGTTNAPNLHDAFAHYRQGATTLHKVPAPNAPVESGTTNAPNLHDAFAHYRQGATTLHKVPAPNAPVESGTTNAPNLHDAFAHYRQGATTLRKVPAPNAPVESNIDIDTIADVEGVE